MLGSALGTVMLAAAIWAASVLLPRARRQGDRFALVCALLSLLVALLGWLLIGPVAHSW